MSFAGNGELVPTGGGDAIPLIRESLTMGRRESCDICMRFPNVSGVHCELTFREGYWIIKDLNSTNGIKVNGSRVMKKVLQPGDTITIAKRTYTIEYTPVRGTQSMDEMMEDVDDFDQPLLEKAGLVRSPRKTTPKPPTRNKSRYIDEEEEEE
jgi:pSer/pThr/pTyr-binding forkhead associated (FHA) protein